MQLPQPGQTGDFATPLLEAFLQLEAKHGRDTAVKEANLLLTSLLLRFDLKPTAAKNYSNAIAKSRSPELNLRMLAAQAVEEPIREPIKIPGEKELGKSLCIFYGSYTKTCETLAKRLKAEAESHNLNVVECGTLDDLVDRIPQELPVIIITSTIHGGPPPNGKSFDKHLKELKPESLKGVNFTVFGSGFGKRERYQKNARYIVSRMKELGAIPIIPPGEGNADGSTRRDFALWKKDHFWGHWGINPPPYSTSVKLTVEDPKIDPDFAYDLKTGQVLNNVVLTKFDTTDTKSAVKRHITIKLPVGMKYTTGDYLSVKPVNPKESVKRAMEMFKLDFNKVLRIRDGGLVLPVGKNISPWRVFSQYVELGRLALDDDIQILARFAKSQETKDALARYLDKENGSYEKEIFDNHVSPLDILEKYPDIEVDLCTFLSILPPLECRRYSISSSPLGNPGECTLTYGVITAKAKVDLREDLVYHGVASTFLSRMENEFTFDVGVSVSEGFRLPGEADREKTPIIMICSGTGLAPFRGFVQERAWLKEHKNAELADALLFIGCQDSVKDRLHADELDKWQSDGLVKLRYAFSRETRKSEGCKYVQDRLAHDKKEVQTFLENEAMIYICGSGKVGTACKDVLRAIMENEMKYPQHKIEEVIETKLHEDVFD